MLLAWASNFLASCKKLVQFHQDCKLPWSQLLFWWFLGWYLLVRGSWFRCEYWSPLGCSRWFVRPFPSWWIVFQWSKLRMFWHCYISVPWTCLVLDVKFILEFVGMRSPCVWPRLGWRCHCCCDSTYLQPFICSAYYPWPSMGAGMFIPTWITSLECC